MLSLYTKGHIEESVYVKQQSEIKVQEEKLQQSPELVDWMSVIERYLDLGKESVSILLGVCFVIDYFETIFANKITKNLNDDKKLNNYLFEASLPCLYKFLYGFVYLYDSNKNFEYSDNV